MRILTVVIAILAAIVATVAAGVVNGGGLSCAGPNNSTVILNPPRLCGINIRYDTQSTTDVYGKSCNGKRLIDFLSKCNMASSMHLMNETIYRDYNLTSECWNLQCSVSF